MTVPELANDHRPGNILPAHVLALVGEIRVHLTYRVFPHRAAITVAKQHGAFQQVLVIGIDLSAEVAAGVCPLSSLDVDVRSDETNRRTPFVRFYKSAFRSVVED